jgi:NAD(P)-dependent dehydrogenase (short-subunit alcohol dehydrogenase family)
MLFAFASAGASVVAAGRSIAKLESAKQEVLARTTSNHDDDEHELKVKQGSIECEALDLGDYDSILSFVETLRKSTKYVTFYVTTGEPLCRTNLQGLQV